MEKIKKYSNEEITELINKAELFSVHPFEKSLANATIIDAIKVAINNFKDEKIIEINFNIPLYLKSELDEKYLSNIVFNNIQELKENYILIIGEKRIMYGNLISIKNAIIIC